MFKKFDIVTDENPLLRKKCEKVEIPISEEDKQLALDMLDYVKGSQDDKIIEEYGVRPGIGLAAPQIGISKRIIAIHLEDDDTVHSYALINPELVSYSVQISYLDSGEGCLSVPKDVEGYVYRCKKVTVKGFDALTNKEVTIKAKGMLSIALQHELDHLMGVLYYDRINKKDPFAILKGAEVVE